MKLSDLFQFAWQSQTQHKLRSSLTLLGVILGAFLVVVTVSIGQGVQEVIPRLMRRNDRLRRIDAEIGGQRERGAPCQSGSVVALDQTIDMQQRCWRDVHVRLQGRD